MLRPDTCQCETAFMCRSSWVWTHGGGGSNHRLCSNEVIGKQNERTKQWDDHKEETVFWRTKLVLAYTGVRKVTKGGDMILHDTVSPHCNSYTSGYSCAIFSAVLTWQLRVHCQVVTCKVSDGRALDLVNIKGLSRIVNAHVNDSTCANRIYLSFSSTLPTDRPEFWSRDMTM
jgi:hypothetical protein